jgi:hypothetical protein
MKIRQIKQGHVTNCPWCKTNGQKVQAVWHLTRANIQACEEHLPLLCVIRDEANAHASSHYSEADYQTWLRQLPDTSTYPK